MCLYRNADPKVKLKYHPNIHLMSDMEPIKKN
jgi:hypothetical protein